MYFRSISVKTARFALYIFSKNAPTMFSLAAHINLWITFYHAPSGLFLR